MIAPLLLLICIFYSAGGVPVEAPQRYLVKLRSVRTMDTLFKLDDLTKTSQHLRDCMLKKYSFGDFEGFSAELGQDLVDQLSKNPLVSYLQSLGC